MKPFQLPDLGEGLPDAEIVRWLVKEGDLIALDQPMVEMETAKAVVEVPSPMKGVVTKLGGKEGDVIEVGAVLVEFDGEIGSPDKPLEKPAVSQKVNSKTASSTQNYLAQSPAPVKSKVEKAASNNETQQSELQTFHLPDLGEGLPDAEIVRWLVKEGDSLSIDQPMVEMETAKAVVEVPSPFAARVSKLHGKEGDVIEVGAALISFGGAKSSESVDSSQVAIDKKAPIPSSSKVDAATVVGSVEVGNKIVSESASTVIKALARKLKIDLSKVVGTGSNGQITQSDVKLAKKSATAENDFSTKVTVEIDASQVADSVDDNPLKYKASPAVRAYARRLGVALSKCQATGAKNTISKQDVERANATSVNSHKSSVVSARSNSLPSVSISVEPQKIRGVRRAMAMGMAKSHASVVPTTLMEDADITAWPKQDALPRYVRALVVAAKVEPALNAWFDGENFERLLHPQVAVGIAIDSPDGLYVPVVKQADSKSAEQIRADVQSLRQKIDSKGLKQEDQQDATITLSNFGSIAGRYGTPVVSPPQVAILGTGRYRNELKLTDKGIENRKMLPLSLSFDHRACTGGEAARFLAAVIQDLSKAN
ncbi:MAG: 2-oxo acid dehydrogenase subunit E2 [Enterobacterales bacterium]|nr:2-oxo acid dehydrogenase subunit E2 [Enterobacterales bacterium]